MAFMGGPRLVLLDEPAGGVNLTMLGRPARSGWRRSTARSGATFVVIEHNMEFVMSLCTRVMVMAEGKVLAMGVAGRGSRQPRRDRSLSRPLRERHERRPSSMFKAWSAATAR